MGCRKEKSQIAGSQKGSHCCTLDPAAVDDCFLDGHEVLCLRIPSDGIAARKREELAPFGQWSELIGVAWESFPARLGGHV